VPLQESYVLLYNSAERTEIKLGLRQGHAREPTNLPGRTASWLLVCDGRFDKAPRDVLAVQGRQKHHYVAIAVLVAALARVAMAALALLSPTL